MPSCVLGGAETRTFCWPAGNLPLLWKYTCEKRHTYNNAMSTSSLSCLLSWWSISYVFTAVFVHTENSHLSSCGSRWTVFLFMPFFSLHCFFNITMVTTHHSSYIHITFAGTLHEVNCLFFSPLLAFAFSLTHLLPPPAFTFSLNSFPTFKTVQYF